MGIVFANSYSCMELPLFMIQSILCQLFSYKKTSRYWPLGGDQAV